MKVKCFRCDCSGEAMKNHHDFTHAWKGEKPISVFLCSYCWFLYVELMEALFPKLKINKHRRLKNDTRFQRGLSKL